MTRDGKMGCALPFLARASMTQPLTREDGTWHGGHQINKCPSDTVWLPRLCQRLLFRRRPLPPSLALFVLPTSRDARPQNLSCVRASANHLVITAAAAAFSLLFPLPFPCIDSSSASPNVQQSVTRFCRVARSSQGALSKPGDEPCNSRQKQAATRGGCNQGGRGRRPKLQDRRFRGR